MDKATAIETAYNWIERTFIDNLVYCNGFTNVKYNLFTEMCIENHQANFVGCWWGNFKFAEKLKTLPDYIPAEFEKKSYNSVEVTFNVKDFRHGDIELVIEWYKSILREHSVEKNPTSLRDGTNWVRGLINDGWFVYDKKEKEFWFFTPEFKVLDKKIENEVESFTIEVSLSDFKCIDEVHVMSQAKERYSNEPEVMKWIVEQVILEKKPRKIK